MGEPKLLELRHTIGLKVSAGQLSHWLIHDQEVFHQEKAELVRAGLHSTPYQHLDSTATGLFGQSYQCHILCNPLYTAYTTLPGKDRYSLLKMLRAGEAMRYWLNSQVLDQLAEAGVAAKTRASLSLLPLEQEWSEVELDHRLAQHLPQLRPSRTKLLKELMAVASYQGRQDYPQVQLLVTDDALQCEGLSSERALCWLHESWHYKSCILRPAMPVSVTPSFWVSSGSCTSRYYATDKPFSKRGGTATPSFRYLFPDSH